MTDRSDLRLVHELVERVPELRPLFDEHLADNDEVLPHLFLSAVAREVQRWTAADDWPLDRLRRLFDRFEREMGPDETRAANAISLSFLQNLDHHLPAHRRLRELMGPALRAEDDAYDWA